MGLKDEAAGRGGDRWGEEVRGEERGGEFLCVDGCFNQDVLKHCGLYLKEQKTRH